MTYCYPKVTSGLCTTLACLLFAIIRPGVTYWAYSFIAPVLIAIGYDVLTSAGSLFVARFALPHEQSIGGALFNTLAQVCRHKNTDIFTEYSTSFQLGTAAGVTITTVVYNSVDTPEVDMLPKYHAAQWAACSFGILGK